MNIRPKVVSPQSSRRRAWTRSVRALALIAVAACASTVPLAVSAEGAPAHHRAKAATYAPHTRKVSAYQLVTSLGVNTHLSETSSPYRNIQSVGHLLAALGARYVRDNIHTDSSQESAALQDLARGGIRSDLIFPQPADAATQRISPAVFAWLKGPVVHSVTSIEDPNEYDYSGRGSDWQTHLRDYDALLAGSLAKYPGLQRRLSLIGPSFANLGDAESFGSVDQYAGFANVHNYPWSGTPESSMARMLPGTAQSGGFSSLGQLVVTEVGYNDALQDPNANVQPALTDQAAAVYLTRALLDDLRMGVTRTFLYELFDQHADPADSDAELHYGLVSSTGQRKPAFTAVENLMHDVAQGDPNGVKAARGTVRHISVKTASQFSYVYELVITDARDRGVTVALWLPIAYDPSTASVRAPVTVMTNAAVRGVQRTPTGTNRGVKRGVHRSFTVKVGRAVTLLHLTPVG